MHGMELGQDQTDLASRHLISSFLKYCKAEEALEVSRRRRTEQQHVPDESFLSIKFNFPWPITVEELRLIEKKEKSNSYFVPAVWRLPRELREYVFISELYSAVEITPRQWKEGRRVLGEAADGGEALCDGCESTRERQLRSPTKGYHQQATAAAPTQQKSSPCWTVQQMMETMERIMEDPSGYYPSSAADETGAGYRRGGRTPWEIKEGENEYKMRFDMPGMTKKDVKLWVEEKMLVIRAEKQSKKSPEGEEQEKEDEWSAMSYGRYSSRIGLPENIEVENIKAEVRDGVLYVTIPKAKIVNKVLDINVE
ncbi:hypothetical protein ACLOJK_008224 [Asimina triloba]